MVREGGDRVTSGGACQWPSNASLIRRLIGLLAKAPRSGLVQRLRNGRELASVPIDAIVKRILYTAKIVRAHNTWQTYAFLSKIKLRK